MKLSVITVNYNNKKGLEATINSVISQKYLDFEFIIVDGNSNDGSKDIIYKKRNYITKWINEPDSGIYNAMNKGVKMSTGDYLIFMNSGDEFYDTQVLDKIAKVLLQANEVGVCTGITYNNDKSSSFWYPPKNLTLYYFLSSSISHQASFIRRDLLLKFPYNEKNRIVSDWEFWIRSIILADCGYKTTDIVICKYDRSGMSNTQYGKLMSEREEVKKRILPPKILKDYYHMTYDSSRENPFVQTALAVSSKSEFLSKFLNKISKITYNIYCKYKGVEK